MIYVSLKWSGQPLSHQYVFLISQGKGLISCPLWSDKIIFHCDAQNEGRPKLGSMGSAGQKLQKVVKTSQISAWQDKKHTLFPHSVPKAECRIAGIGSKSEMATPYPHLA